MGASKDRFFGDAGDDTIFLGLSVALETPEITAAGMYGETLTYAGGPSTDTATNISDFASGGTGNDTIIGTTAGNTMFGGPGHDFLMGDNADNGVNQLYGGHGDD